jgi:HEAT repeat protein
VSNDPNLSGDEPSFSDDFPENVADLPALGGDLAVLHLVENLAHPDEEIRQRALFALAELGDDRALDGLIHLIRTGTSFTENHIGQRAAFALAPFGVKAVHQLLSILKEEQPNSGHARNAALRGLGVVASANLELSDLVIPGLVEALATRATRSAAADALGVIGKNARTPQVIDSLLQAMVDTALTRGFESQFYDAPAVALGRIGEPGEVLPRMLQLAKSDAPRLVELLSQVVRGDGFRQQATPYLVEALLSEEYSVDARGYILEALGLTGDPEAIQYLLPLLDRDNPLWRHAVEAIGRIPDRRAIPALVKLLHTYPEEEMGPDSAVVEALGIIGDKAAAPYLRPYIDNFSSGMIVMRALGKLQDTESVPALIAQLENHQDAFRSINAGVALLDIGTVEALAAVESLKNDAPALYDSITSTFNYYRDDALLQ